MVAKAGKVPGNLLEVSVFFCAKLFSVPRVRKLCSKDEVRETLSRQTDFSSEGFSSCEPWSCHAGYNTAWARKAQMFEQQLLCCPLETGTARHS